MGASTLRKRKGCNGMSADEIGGVSGVSVDGKATPVAHPEMPGRGRRLEASLF
jgi:hypothetical protein